MISAMPQPALQTGSELLDDFMATFRNATSPHPFDSRSRIWGGAVALEVRPQWGKIHLVFIQSLDPKAGRASAALDWLTDLAGARSLAVDGIVARVGQKGLTLAQLKSWYKRHGFTIKGDQMVWDARVDRANKAKAAVAAFGDKVTAKP